MATNLKNLSDTSELQENSAKDLKFGVVVAKWHSDITEKLYAGTLETLKKYGASKIYRLDVPGSFELTYGAKKLLLNEEVDVIIVIGCIIQGETRHFDFVANSVTEGITQLNLKYNTPVIFCVLTTNNLKQAQDRAGGKYGNKGVEAAVAAIEMAKLNKNFLEVLKTE